MVTAAEREGFLKRYEAGPALLRAAWDKVPVEARQWRPAPGKWSAHEVVIHAADSETNGAGRIRYVLAEKEPLIVGYDENEWAKAFDYHACDVELAFKTIEAVHANTAPMLRRVPDGLWLREGRHTDSGLYRAADWLRIYAEHLEVHARQIERNLMAWEEQNKV